MKIPEPWRATCERLRAEALHLGVALKGQVADVETLSRLLQPDLGTTPRPLARVVEPLLAAAALSLFATLFVAGASSFAALVLVAGLMYAILTRVFGIELDAAR